MQNLIQLDNLNQMQTMTNTKDRYKVNFSNALTAYHSVMEFRVFILPYMGSNIYNSTNGGLPNFDYFFDNVYNQSQYKNAVWEYQICEESAFWNLHNFTYEHQCKVRGRIHRN